MAKADSGIGPAVKIRGRRGEAELLGLEGNLALVYVEGRTRIIQVAPDRVRLLDGSEVDWSAFRKRRR